MSFSFRFGAVRSCRLSVTGLICVGLFLAIPKTLTGGAQGAQKPPARGASSAAAQPAAPKPSLDTLAARVRSFWNLLVAGRKTDATQYVELAGRKNFDAWQLAQLSEPRITTLEMTPKPEEVQVTVEVKRTFPPLPATFSWPVKQSWVFRGWNTTLHTPTQPTD